MHRTVGLAFLASTLGCSMEPETIMPTEQAAIACVLAARYEADTDASLRTHEFLTRSFVNRAMLEEGSFARTSVLSGGFAGPGDGMIAVTFKSDCAHAQQFLTARIEELASDTEDSEILSQLGAINRDWHPITVEQYQRGNW